MSEVSVVILNFNGKDFLKQFLPFFIQHSVNAELVVADNASSDGSVEFLSTTYPNIRVIQLDKNYGFAEGYNRALENITSEFTAIVNSDIEVTENWLEPLVGFLRSNPDYASVQPKIKSVDNREEFEYAGACGGFIDNLGYPYCRGRIFDTLEKDSGQYGSIIDVDWTSGACMVIRTQTFKETGGFDSDFFAHMEEIDLCWRLRSNGWKLACIPDSTVYHVGGGTLNKTSPFKTYLNFRNGLLMLVKNLPSTALFFKLLIRLVLDGVAALKLGTSQSPRHIMAVLKAHFHFYRMYGAKRKGRKKTSPAGQFSIIMAYYLRGEKKFSELP